MTAPLHHFTIDVEDYFQVSALEPFVPRESWEGMERRVERNTDLLLDALAEHRSQATCFVLGWIAERHPELVRRIAAAGHEVASHGQDHRRVTEQTPDEFRRSIRRSKQVLEDITGTPVLGFRAPSFSLVAGREWALDILVEEGYAYDSSLFPVRRRGYGYAGGQREPYVMERAGGVLEEFPPATVRIGGYTAPAAGGAYFRLLPYGLVKAGLRDAERRGVPGTFYIHPWEIDSAQPRIAVSALTRIRHYGGLARTLPRLKRLLTEFRFESIATTRARGPVGCAADVAQVTA